MNDRRLIIIAFGVAIGLAAGALSHAYFEARSYRKFCDTPVTTLDALVLDLRIDECEANK